MLFPADFVGWFVTKNSAELQGECMQNSKPNPNVWCFFLEERRSCSWNFAQYDPNRIVAAIRSNNFQYSQIYKILREMQKANHPELGWIWDYCAEHARRIVREKCPSLDAAWSAGHCWCWCCHDLSGLDNYPFIVDLVENNSNLVLNETWPQCLKKRQLRADMTARS